MPNWPLMSYTSANKVMSGARAALFALMVSSTCMASRHAPPPPTPAPAVPEQRGTDSAPLAVKITEPVPQPAVSDKEKADKQEEHTANLAVAEYTKIMAAVAFVQALIFFWQLSVMRRTLKDTASAVRFAQQDMIHSHRAFCFIPEYQAIPRLISNNEVGSWSFMPMVRNSGDTPTRHAVAECWFQIVDASIGLPDNFDFPNKPQGKFSKFLIGPNAMNGIDGPEISVEDLTDATDAIGKTKVYMWGWIEYNDVFENTERHRTEFCVEIKPVANIFQVEQIKDEGIPFYFLNHSQHNGADSDCMKKPMPFNAVQL